MAKIRPYSLEECQELVEDAKRRYEPRHQWFRSLELLYRTGKAIPLSENTVTGTVFERLNPADLETINMVLPHLNIIIASVVSRDPKPIAVPYAGGEITEMTARVAEAVAGYWWLRTNSTGVLRDMAQDMVILGNGFCKVGWKLVEEEIERDADEVASELAQVRLADIAAAVEEGTDTEREEVIESYVSTTERIVQADEPFVEYVSPYDIFFPENARRLEESRWIAQRIVLPIDEIRSNPSFKNTKDVLPDSALDSRDQELGRVDSFAASEVYDSATIYEFYDMRTRNLTVFQLGMDRPLFKGPIPYTHRYAPFVQMRNFSDGGNEIWAFGDLENIASLQEKLNEVFTEQVDNMRRSGNKYVAAKDTFDALARDRLESDEPDIVVEVDVPAGQSLRDILIPIPRAPLPADVYNAQMKFEDAMRQILGINDFQAGGVGADRMSAYAAAVVDGVATLRAKDKQQSVEKSAAQIFNVIIRLCQEFMEDTTAIRLVGANGGVWADVDSAVLTGEFDMRVEGGSLSAMNPAVRQARAMEMLGTVVPVLGGMGYDTEPALRHIVRDLGYDPDQFLVRPGAAPQPAAPAPEQGGAPAGLPPELLGGLPPELGALGAPAQTPTAEALTQLEQLTGQPPLGL
jgi:hypothetical protein